MRSQDNEAAVLVPMEIQHPSTQCTQCTQRDSSSDRIAERSTGLGHVPSVEALRGCVGRYSELGVGGHENLPAHGHRRLPNAGHLATVRGRVP